MRNSVRKPDPRRSIARILRPRLGQGQAHRQVAQYSIESFETDSWRKTWQEISHPESKEIETDVAIVLAGRRALRLPLTPEAADTGAGWMHYWWEGLEEVYLRYYFRLSKGGNWRNNCEVMVKLNEVGQQNGEQRLWIYGRLVIEQTGMEWRKTDKLVLNNLMLSTNTSAPPKPGEKRTVWIDAVVLARRYIGPINRKRAVGTTSHPARHSRSQNSRLFRMRNDRRRRLKAATCPINPLLVPT